VAVRKAYRRDPDLFPCPEVEPEAVRDLSRSLNFELVWFGIAQAEGQA
jgi:hypothetical protein